MYLEWLNTAWNDPANSLDQYPFKGQFTPHYRLIKAVLDANYRVLDFVSLLRAVLRFEEVNKSIDNVILKIPSIYFENINIQALKKCAVEIIKETSSWFYIKTTYSPLQFEDDIDFDAHTLNQNKIRQENVVKGDSFLSIFSYKTYQSKVQRESIRSIFCAPPGETLAINLPTGAGKSLCAFLPALLPLSNEDIRLGVTPIVVPTISLALDMANKLKHIIGHEVAYRPENKESAKKIRIRCEKGIQGPVIVSPESIVNSLSYSLIEAAKRGLLRYFIIDEAHMVLSWGDEFRPGFQILSSLRKKMLSVSHNGSFKTLLLSATFTEYHLIWLEKMFSEEANFSILHSVKLRPEPSFWQIKATDEDHRRHVIVNAICHLPKPIILYSVTRVTAKWWHDYLKEYGFSRIGMLHGRVSISKKKELMKSWVLQIMYFRAVCLVPA